MKVLNFKYKAANGKESSRVLAVAISPSDAYEGCDISELSTEDQALYVTEHSRLYEQYLAQISALNQKYDLNYRYRRFLPSGMSDIKTETY